MISRFATLAFSVAALVLASPAFAQAPTGFPAKPVRFIIPFPGGGVNDVLARVAAEKLQERWGQPIIIESKTGAGGSIGANYAYHAEPDGYTLLVSATGPLAINPSLYKQLGYRAEEFVPITVLASVPNLITVRAELGVDTVAALVKLAKANPGKLTYGSQGVGSTPNLNANMFMNMTGTQFVHVPYRGETLVVSDMLGGHVDMFFGNISPVLPHYRDGKFKILAVADTMRAPAIPDVPTTAEAGLPGFLSTAWFAVMGPPKLPDVLAQRFAADFIEVVRMPDVAARYRAVGTEPVGSTPARTGAFIREEIARWREVIVRNNIQVE
ncbi:MAG TPA: tripartite tricarboxylate transporter substrate binding protein [Xanthobacteraceae bacterium]|jgi:tripartite-type tricarboxylate transporter receptor subunit TctC|nr:tripartite tricarboxylate transporter substrate binding protein [Xanthobacteraceae bacterium]